MEQLTRQSYRLPILVLAGVSSIIVLSLIFVGWRYGKRQSQVLPPAPELTSEGSTLSPAEREMIRRFLEERSSAEPPTEAEREDIRQALELPPDQAPLTEEERLQILRVLEADN